MSTNASSSKTYSSQTRLSRVCGEPPLKLAVTNAHYGDHSVLSNISVDITPGEKIAVLGKSGVGKSTLLTLLHQQWLNTKVDVALIPQQLGLVSNLSGWHNIYMGQLDRRNALYNLCNLIYRMPARQREIAQLAQLLELSPYLHKPAGELSGGQQQRVAIARALYHSLGREAPIIIADEPVANLDGPLANNVMATLTSRADTMVVALHDVNLARQYCNRIIGLHHGEVTVDCASQDLDEQMLNALYDKSSSQ